MNEKAKDRPRESDGSKLLPGALVAVATLSLVFVAVDLFGGTSKFLLVRWFGPLPLLILLGGMGWIAGLWLQRGESRAPLGKVIALALVTLFASTLGGAWTEAVSGSFSGGWIGGRLATPLLWLSSWLVGTNWLAAAIAALLLGCAVAFARRMVSEGESEPRSVADSLFGTGAKTPRQPGILTRTPILQPQAQPLAPPKDPLKRRPEDPQPLNRQEVGLLRSPSRIAKEAEAHQPSDSGRPQRDAGLRKPDASTTLPGWLSESHKKAQDRAEEPSPAPADQEDLPAHLLTPPEAKAFSAAETGELPAHLATLGETQDEDRLGELEENLAVEREIQEAVASTDSAPAAIVEEAAAATLAEDVAPETPIQDTPDAPLEKEVETVVAEQESVIAQALIEVEEDPASAEAAEECFAEIEAQEEPPPLFADWDQEEEEEAEEAKSVTETPAPELATSPDPEEAVETVAEVEAPASEPAEEVTLNLFDTGTEPEAAEPELVSQSGEASAEETATWDDSWSEAEDGVAEALAGTEVPESDPNLAEETPTDSEAAASEETVEAPQGQKEDWAPWQDEAAAPPLLFTVKTNVSNEVFKQAVELIRSETRCSAPLIQREMGITRSEANQIIERMENEGLVGPRQASGQRDVLLSKTNEA